MENQFLTFRNTDTISIGTELGHGGEQSSDESAEVRAVRPAHTLGRHLELAVPHRHLLPFPYVRATAVERARENM